VVSPHYDELMWNLLFRPCVSLIIV